MRKIRMTFVGDAGGDDGDDDDDVVDDDDDAHDDRNGDENELMSCWQRWCWLRSECHHHISGD